MTDVWTAGETSTGDIEVTVKLPNGNKIETYSAETKLSEVVNTLLPKYDIKNATISDVNGKTLEEEAGNRTMGSIGPLTILAKTMGA